jgi:peptidoglycan/xylan/chitin deacetylase (PgdA/CDA1 family)
LVVSLVVNVEEGAQMSPQEGDSGAEPVDELGVVVGGGRPNLANDTNYRYGLNEGFTRVASVLESTGVSATWTCAATALERSPEIAEFIRSRGDEAACHGLRWVHQFRMSEDAERQFIAQAATSIEATCGERPAGYLARYLFTSSTRQILADEGFLYDMDDYSSDSPFWDLTTNPPIVIVPYAIDTNDMKMWTAPSYTPDAWRKYLEDTLDVLLREGSTRPVMMSVGVHLRVVGRPGRIAAWRAFVEQLVARGVAVARRADIAARFRELYPLAVDPAGPRTVAINQTPPGI